MPVWLVICLCLSVPSALAFWAMCATGSNSEGPEERAEEEG